MAPITRKITIEKALDLICSFALHSQLSSIANSKGFGGTFRLDSFTQYNGQKTKALLGWFCYALAQVETDNKFFFALEGTPVETPAGTPPTPSASIAQLVSSQQFLYTGAANVSAVESFFKSQQVAIPSADNTATVSQINLWKAPFLSQFPLGNTNPYNSSAFGYIENGEDCEVYQFINQSQEIKAVRYFFGFDSSALNNIKVIFVPVDINGKNIKAFSDGSVPFYLDRTEP